MRGKKSKSPAAIKMPSEEWKDAFRSYNIRVGLNLQLSRAMLEMLCAIADGVHWDRSAFGGAHCPDNWMATRKSLHKRGLIVFDQEAFDNWRGAVETKIEQEGGLWATRECYSLTPAGKCLVDLLRVVGLFIEADAAEIRKSILKRG